jgi:hypothetical protein
MDERCARARGLNATIIGHAAGVGGGMRAQLARRQFNHFAVAALSVVAASGTYLVASLPGARLGFAFPHPAGFISSVLFLIPGFPSAVSRLAYGTMVRWRSRLGSVSSLQSAGSTSRRSRLSSSPIH